MRTRKKYLKNSQEFKRLLHHRRSGSKKNTDKVWICEPVGKLKVVGQLEIVKMNNSIIHTIADLQLHICNHSKVPIQGFDQIYYMALQDLPGNFLLLSSTTGNRKIRIFQDMERDGWTN